MITLKAEKRQQIGGNFEQLRQKGTLPAVLYGEGIKESIILQVSGKEFIKVLQEAGESSLLSLEADGKQYNVLIHQIAKDPVSGSFLHVDFFKPSTKKKIEAEVPLEFIGEAPAVKDLAGILVTEFSTMHVKGLAQQLPREITVDLSGLKTFEDRILVKDLKMPEGVEVLRDLDEIVAHVAEPREEEVIEEEPVVEAEGEGGEGGEKPAGETEPAGEAESAKEQKENKV